MSAIFPLPFFLFLCVAPFLVECHLASFVNSEGRPGSGLIPRPIRGPTVPPPLGHTHFLQGDQAYFRPLPAHEEGEEENEDEDGPTFIPYIGPRALGNVRAYLSHIQENLAALQSLEELGESSGESEEESRPSPTQAARRFHARRHILPDGGRRLVGAEGGGELPLLFRRTNNIVPAHHPSWSYTRSGLGRKRSSPGR